MAFFWSYLPGLNTKPPVRILELVAGEGTNYRATEAPALGTPGGVKLNIPVLKPQQAEPEPAPATPLPVTPPAPKAAPAKAPRTPAQEIRRLLANGDLRAKRAVAKEREEEQKRLTKAEFDRLNNAKAAEKGAPTKIQKIDGEGIAKGVAGGSTANKDSGAGGRALTRTEGSARELYETALKDALIGALKKEAAGLSEALIATVVFHIGANGSLTNVRITKSSGSAEFDRAVRAAIRHVSGSIPPPKDYKSDDVELDFRAKEPDGD